MNRLTETLTCDFHTQVRPKKLRAAVGRDLTAAQSIHDGRAERGLWLARLAGSGNGRPQMSSNTPPHHGPSFESDGQHAAQHRHRRPERHQNRRAQTIQLILTLQRILTHTFVGISDPQAIIIYHHGGL